MKALVCESFGPIDQLKVVETPSPELSPGKVLIKISYAAVNFPDALIVQGLYQVKPPLPFSPGHEASGIVSAVGQGVTRFKVGDRVVFTPGFGAFAEEAICDENKVIPLPENMNMKFGACLTLTYGTSYHALKNCAHLKQGETILILGASGGVGSAAIELAKIIGAKVIAAASTDEKLQVCKKLGADELINYETEDLKTRLKDITNGNGVDVVYDAVGGKYSETALRSLGRRGRLLVVGFAAGEIPKIPLNLALLSERSIIGVFWGDWVRRNPQEHFENMKTLATWFEEGKIKPLISETYSLNNAKEAIKHLASRKALGKVAIEINPEII
jgi:NADPH2:quinone reductase